MVYIRLISELFFIAVVALVAFTGNAASDKGPASDRLIFEEYSAEQAISALQSGAIDCYIGGLNFNQSQQIIDDPSLKIFVGSSSINCLLTNPAPASEEELNPLSIREVRFALNYLIGREDIVDQVYGGFATPMVTFLSENDTSFEIVRDVVARYNFDYDPSTASAIIEEAMIEAGAEKSEGMWYYNGKPVLLKFVIRSEDARSQIGERIALSLENAGFSVEKIYANYSQARDLVYQTDPKDLKWHLYTEAYDTSVGEYGSNSINLFGAPWYGDMPGYLVEDWWQYQNDGIDDLGKKIYYGEFDSKEEMEEIYKSCTDLIIQESVRVWIATELAIYPARREVEGITENAATGLGNLWNFREVYLPGQDEIKIGSLYVNTQESAWNPVYGYNDVYSYYIWSAIHDPAICDHPFNGSPQPFRWNYSVQTAGPSGNLTLPEDAFMWNVTSKRWDLVGCNVTSISKVTFDLSKFLGTRWHHHQNITWADVLYSISQSWEIAFDQDKAAIESVVSSSLREELMPIKGFRIVGQDLEVYLDYWHFDDDYIAKSAAVDVYCPWEVLAAMDSVVFDQKALMYSDLASEKNGVPCMSVDLHDHALLVSQALDELQYSDLEGVFNLSLTVYATEEDLAERVNASANWFAQMDNLVISDGPFYLEESNVSTGRVELAAFRDENYPFQKGDWLYSHP